MVPLHQHSINNNYHKILKWYKLPTLYNYASYYVTKLLKLQTLQNNNLNKIHLKIISRLRALVAKQICLSS